MIERNPTTEVTTPQATFQEKMMERIRSNIGDLISNEDLGKLIERGIQETFFEGKPNPRWQSAGFYERNSIPEKLPALIEKIVTECISQKLEEMTKQYFDNWLVENSEKVEGVVKRIVEKGAGDLLVKHISNAFDAPLKQMQSSMVTNLSLLRQQVPGFSPVHV